MTPTSHLRWRALGGKTALQQFWQADRPGDPSPHSFDNMSGEWREIPVVRFKPVSSEEVVQ